MWSTKDLLKLAWLTFRLIYYLGIGLSLFIH